MCVECDAEGIVECVAAAKGAQNGGHC
jgi:hypothetical protein